MNTKPQIVAFQSGCPPWDSVSDMTDAMETFGLSVYVREIHDGDTTLYLINGKELTEAEQREGFINAMRDEYDMEEDEIEEEMAED